MSSLAFTKINGNDIYARGSCVEMEKVQDQLKTFYGAEYAYVVPSGLASIAATLHSLIKQHYDVMILYTSELYCDTPHIITGLRETYGFNRVSVVKIPVETFIETSLKYCWPKASVMVDTSPRTSTDPSTDIDPRTSSVNINTESIKTKRPKTHFIIFAESCSNPNGILLNFPLLAANRDVLKNTTVVIDNTWLTSAVLNPFDFGADIVVTSLSKYYSASSCIAGSVIVKKYDASFCDTLFSTGKHFGFHVSANTCDVLLKQLPSLKARIQESSSKTIAVIQELQKECKSLNLKLYHPYMTINSESKSCFKNNMWPSVFRLSFPIKMTKKDFRQVKDTLMSTLRASKVFECKTSFGGAKSRIDCYPKIGKGLVYLRISVGYNDTSEAKTLVSELGTIIKTIQAAF